MARPITWFARRGLGDAFEAEAHVERVVRRHDCSFLGPEPPRRIQLLRFGPSIPSGSCGAPGTVRSSIGSLSSSNEVLPSPVETSMSSMKTPANC
jgi:hypothetical protein